MKNSYGNYVVQKAIKMSTGNSKIIIITVISKNLDKLTDKKLINKWKTIINNSLFLNRGLDLSLSGYSSNLETSNRSVNNNSPRMLSPNLSSPNNRFSRSMHNSPMNKNMPNLMLNNNLARMQNICYNVNNSPITYSPNHNSLLNNLNNVTIQQIQMIQNMNNQNRFFNI